MNAEVHARACAIPAGLLVVLCLLAGLAGCGRKPRDWHQDILQAEQAARQAYERRDVEAADQAADRAEKALAQLDSIAKQKTPPDRELERLLQEARPAARSARRFSHLAREEKTIRDRLDRLRVRTYRAARGTLSKLAFASFVPVLAQAGSNYANLNPVSRTLADQAWNLAALLAGRPPLEGNQPDWAGAARDMKSWTTNPPPQIGLFLSAVWQVSGFPALALFEIESAQPSTNTPPVLRLLSHAQRAFLYDGQGLPHLASREVERATALTTNLMDRGTGNQLMAVLHLYFSGRALQGLDFSRADAELSQALALWPDNLLTLLVKAEKMAANGQWQSAAEFLEEQATAAGREDWAAKKLRQRAQELRDSKGRLHPLADDKRLFLECLWNVAASALSESKAADHWRGFMDAALDLGKKLADQLPSEKAEPQELAR